MAKYLDYNGVKYLWQKMLAKFAPLTRALPSGGTTGQALKKSSNTDYDASWAAIHEIPSGGQANQVLKKASNSDYDVIWYTDQDFKVDQNKSTANDNYPVLMSYPTLTQWGSAVASTESTKISVSVYANPSTGYFTAAKFSSDGTNYYEIGAAAEKAIGSVASGNTGLVTGDAVYQALQGVTPSITGDLIYKGAVSANSSLLNVALVQGYTYVASADFTIDSHNVQTGDLLIVNTDGTYSTQSALWAAIDVIQSNLDRMTDTDIDNAIAEAEAA